MEFEVLGPLRVRGGNLPLTGRMPRTLLAILLVRANTAVPVDTLIDTLWGGRMDERAPKKLQLHVHRLRRALGDASRIRFEHSGYLFRIGPGELDAERFETLLAQAADAVSRGEPDPAAELIRRALGLWRGEPFGDVADIPILRAEAERLAELRLAGLEELYAAELASGRRATLVPDLAELAVQHPLRERLQALLMTALYGAGRPADALAVYRRTRTNLVGDLGIEPGTELQRLHRAVLTSDPALDVVGPHPAPTPAQLPPDATDVIGRDDELAAVLARLTGTANQSRGAVIVAVAGKPGVGKTTLAVHVAHELREEFPDGQLYVNLRGAEANPLDPAEVLARFLRALGMQDAMIPETVDERASTYRSRLAGRRIVVLLDNAATAGQVRPLLPGTGSCAVLVTSRSRLAALEGAVLVDLDILEPDQAIELLARVAGPERVAEEPDAAGEVVRSCGLLPLAVRIAAARLVARPHWRLSRLAANLADEHRRLDELRLGDLEVRASLTLSYAGLDPLAQRALRHLGLLEVPDVAAWAAAALLDIPLAGAEQVIDALVEARLLELSQRDAAGQQRYRFHDLIRVYARERARTEDPESDRHLALDRALGAWLSLAERANQTLLGGEYWVEHSDATRWRFDPSVTEALLTDQLAFFTAERACLLAAVEQAAVTGRDECAWDLANSLALFLELRGLFDDWRRTHEIALAASRRTGNRLGEAVMLRGLAMLDLYQDRYDDAMTRLERAQVAFRNSEDRHGEVDVTTRVGLVHRARGWPDRAQRCFERALPVLRELADGPGEAQVLHCLGLVHLEQGRFGAAREHLDRALVAFRRCGFRHGEARALRRLGQLHQAQGQLDEAVTCLEQCLVVFGELGERHANAHALYQLGAVRAQLGQWSEAQDLLDGCLQTFRELGDRSGEALSLHSLGELHRAQLRFEQANACLERALEIWRDLRLPLWEARTLNSFEAMRDAAGHVI